MRTYVCIAHIFLNARTNLAYCTYLASQVVSSGAAADSVLVFYEGVQVATEVCADMHMILCVCIYVVCVFTGIPVCMCVRMHVCMYIYVCMHVCVHAWLTA